MWAVITGGSKGLGFYIAKELKNKNYDLVLIARYKEDLKKAASLLNADYYSINLSKEYKKAGEIIEKYKPEILINNAGLGLYGFYKEQNWEKLEDMLSLNIIALSYLTHKFLKVRDSGYILNISSVAACRRQPKLSAYAATKSYVEQFTRSLSKELPNSIKISYLLLGPTKTNFFKNAKMPSRNLEKIMLDPEKVAKYTVKMMLKNKRRIIPKMVYKLYCLGK